MKKSLLRFSSTEAPFAFAFFSLLLNVPAILLAYNYSNLSQMDGLSFFISVLLSLFVTESVIYHLIILPKIYKLALSTITFLNITVLYFMWHYSLVIDKDTVTSVFSTNFREASEYFSAELFIVLACGIAISFFMLTKLQIEFDGFRKEFKKRSFMLTVLIAIFIANFFLFFKDYSFFFRQQKTFKHLVLPINYIDAVVGAMRIANAKNKKIINIHLESHSNGNVWKNIKKKSVFVLVIGETARAQNFSLDGYLRKTNPKLEKIPHLISFLKTESCGTSTSVSVPCIFDFRGRENFVDASANYTNLLDVAQNAGFRVTWIDNNTGCQDVCDRVHQIPITTLPQAKAFCDSSGCLDMILLGGLKKAIEESKDQKQLVVLHMLGSHGPKYYKRYPENFGLFQPDCQGDDLSNCTQQQIINSYDNTILYTDTVLSEIITYLDDHKNWNSNLIYISDHGESLGEKGLYLHAMPYKFAPEEQTHVPFIFWSNDSFLNEFNYDLDCVKNKSSHHYSHNNMFHSYVGLMNILDKHYKPEMDIFKTCRQSL
ncbi:MAG: phosphoethanolamine--lipid A transferase [Bdellovibrionaceae bacterium]|nr:phosphoethanolamine--lipid A transferase [Pseudobdellovibrionaceae bacterium]